MSKPLKMTVLTQLPAFRSEHALNNAGMMQTLHMTKAILIDDIPGRAMKKRMEIPIEWKVWKTRGTNTCLIEGL